MRRLAGGGARGSGGPGRRPAPPSGFRLPGPSQKPRSGCEPAGPRAGADLVLPGALGPLWEASRVSGVSDLGCVRGQQGPAWMSPGLLTSPHCRLALVSSWPGRRRVPASRAGFESGELGISCVFGACPDFPSSPSAACVPLGFGSCRTRWLVLAISNFIVTLWKLLSPSSRLKIGLMFSVK